MAERGEPGGACERLRGRAPRRFLANRRSQRAIQSWRASPQSGGARSAGDSRQVGAGDYSGPLPGFGREPERAAHPRQQHPPRASPSRRHYDRPHHHKHHIRHWWIVRRRRNGGQFAAADWRFWPDHVCLWRPGGRLYRDPVFRSLDATRCDRRHRGFGRRSRRLGGGRNFHWMALDDRVGRPGRRRPSRPVETSREFVGRLLQFPALELLSDAPEPVARGAWPAPGDRIAGHDRPGRRVACYPAPAAGSPAYAIPPPQ